MTNEQIDYNNELILSKQSKYNLEATRKWTLLLSILGFIFIGFMVVFAFGFSFFMEKISSMGSGPAMPFPSWIGLFYLIFVPIYFFPIWFLYKFSKYMKIGIRTSDSKAIDVAFQNLKSHYTFMGVLAIIIVGIYLLMALGFGFASMMF